VLGEVEKIGGNGMKEVKFYYEVSPLAQMAHDGDGNDAKAYMEIKLELGIYPSEEDYEILKGAVKKMLFQQTGVKVEHLMSISKEEYDANHDDE
jgi:hypothetical protein